jgi:hypothetical protein
MGPKMGREIVETTRRSDTTKLAQSASWRSCLSLCRMEKKRRGIVAAKHVSTDPRAQESASLRFQTLNLFSISRRAHRHDVAIRIDAHDRVAQTSRRLVSDVHRASSIDPTVQSGADIVMGLRVLACVWRVRIDRRNARFIGRLHPPRQAPAQNERSEHCPAPMQLHVSCRLFRAVHSDLLLREVQLRSLLVRSQGNRLAVAIDVHTQCWRARKRGHVFLRDVTVLLTRNLCRRCT